MMHIADQRASLGVTCPTSRPVSRLEVPARENPPASYYRARYYDSTAGRFLNEDSLETNGDDVNFYRYSYEDPTNFTDPFGLQGTTTAPPPVTAPAPPSAPPTPTPTPKPTPTPVPEPPGLPILGPLLGAIPLLFTPMPAGPECLDVHGTANCPDKPPPCPDKDKADKCDEQYELDKAYCSEKFWGTKLYGACRDRAFWRWNNCRRGLPSPGPLDPRKWK